jgi:uncharacterized protein YndB with AHSA1/START domain
MNPAIAVAHRALLTLPSDREYRFERTFDAQRERVWRAMTEPELIAQWWGRGNRLVIERFEFERGGHWRFVEHSKDGPHGFEGRYREIVPIERIVSSFEWDGMPAHVLIQTMTFEQLADGRTKLVCGALFHTPSERDQMVQLGMEEGTNQSYAALDRVLSQLG